MDQKQKSKNLSIAIKLLHNYLLENKDSKEYSYLASRVPEDKFPKFSFGLFPLRSSAITDFIDEFSKISKEDPFPILEQLNLIYDNKVYKRESCFFKEHSLLIPFYDLYGNPVSIVGRSILPEDKQKELKISKYKHLPFEKGKYLYGLNYTYKNIIKKDYLIAVEGQFDFISGLNNGMNNIVCVAGSKFTFDHICILKRFTNNFYVLLDNDEAGNEGWKKINKMKTKYNLNVKRLSLPGEYKDLDLYLRDGNQFSVD